VESEDVGMKR